MSYSRARKPRVEAAKGGKEANGVGGGEAARPLIQGSLGPSEPGIRERKKPINIKEFGGTPPGVCPVCPVEMSHLSRHMSRLSRGHSAP